MFDVAHERERRRRIAPDFKSLLEIAGRRKDHRVAAARARQGCEIGKTLDRCFCRFAGQPNRAVYVIRCSLGIRPVLRAVKEIVVVGLAFSVQEIAQVPALPHDARLDYIATERETIDTRRR